MQRRLPLALAGLTLLLAACSRNDTPPAPERPVRLMTVAAGSTVPAAELAGEVRARIESSLGFRVAGKIVSRRVETGQRVHRGDELARVDPRDFQLSDQAASAQLDRSIDRVMEYEKFKAKFRGKDWAGDLAGALGRMRFGGF